MVGDSIADDALLEEQLKLTYLAGGGTLKDMRQIPQVDMDTMYRVAYGHYTAKRYNISLVVFRYLSLLDHFNYSYLLGLGASLSGLMLFQESINVLDSAISINDVDPRGFICKAECLMSLKNLKGAKAVLQEAKSHAKSSGKWKSECLQINRLQNTIGNC